MARSKSSGKGIAVFALLLAIAILSFQIYFTYVTPPPSTIESEETPEITITGVWYVKNDDFIYTSPAVSYITIPELSVDFEIESGESVYVLYSSRVGVREISGWNYVEVHLAIDGVRIDNVENKFLLYTTDGGSYNIVPLTLQYSNSSIEPGEHTVSILIIGSYSNNYVSFNTLLVQTYVS